MLRIAGSLAVTLTAFVSLVQAEVVIEMVTVGDPGNAGEYSGSNYNFGPVLVGEVDYTYNIGKYEVTNGQYREFLNAKAALGDSYRLWNSSMRGIVRTGTGTLADPFVYSAKDGDATWDSRPVSAVTFWNAARFCNWLHNGQGSRPTEMGAYTSIGNDTLFARQAGAKFFLPTEDEWYKAAYYKSGSRDAGYWEYATQSDVKPDNNAPANDSGNSANGWDADGYTVGPPDYSVPVDSYGLSESVYGTLNQNGNVEEWTETAIDMPYSGAVWRATRGGSWDPDGVFRASYRDCDDPTYANYLRGFRVASPFVPTTVPEPSTIVALLLGIVSVIIWKRRKALGDAATG